MTNGDIIPKCTSSEIGTSQKPFHGLHTKGVNFGKELKLSANRCGLVVTCDGETRKILLQGDESEPGRDGLNGRDGRDGRDGVNTEPVNDARITALETMIATLSGQVATLTATNEEQSRRIDQLSADIDTIKGGL